MTITGHRQEQSFHTCNSGNKDDQRQLSNLIIDDKEVHFNQKKAILESLRTVPTFVSVHTFCASRKAWFKDGAY